MDKTNDKYAADWTENKDLIRGTWAVEDLATIPVCLVVIQTVCNPGCGMTLIKSKIRNPDADDYGYRDLNCVIQLVEYAMPIEVQVNTFIMLYAKHYKEEYLKMVYGSDTSAEDLDGYRRLQTLSPDVPGGLGHYLYDIGHYGD